MMDEITMNILTALTDACEGHLVLNHAGIESATSDENLNMVRVGKAICEEIEKQGYKVIHDRAKQNS